MKDSLNYAKTNKSVLALIGAFSFAFFVGIALHETGHAIMIKYFGIDEVKIVLHPFKASETIWEVNNDYIGYVDVAGPIFNIFVGNIIMTFLWRRRNQIISPFLLLGPTALIQEGFNSIMQLLLHIPGTDSIRIVASGIPYTIVLSVAILFSVLGLVMFCLQLPLYGISLKDSFLGKLVILLPGLTVYMLIVLLYEFVFSPSELMRGLILTVFSTLVATLLATIYKPINSSLEFLAYTDVALLNWHDVWIVLGLGSVVIILGLLF